MLNYCFKGLFDVILLLHCATKHLKISAPCKWKKWTCGLEHVASEEQCSCIELPSFVSWNEKVADGGEAGRKLELNPVNKFLPES